MHVSSSSVRTLQRLSNFECCADTAVREKERNGMLKVKYTRAFRLLLLIGNVLKTDSKTMPTSKFNCRVIILFTK